MTTSYPDAIDDYNDPEVIKRVIRDWHASHDHRGDQRSPIVLKGECRVPDLLGEL
jgi:hypothetical protein